MSALFRAYRRAYAGLPREVWLMAAVIFVNRCGTMVLPFLALYLKTEQGFTASAAGRMLAVYGTGAVAGAWLGGRLTARLGGVLVAFLGMALAVPGFAVIPFCGSGAGLAAALLYLSLVFEAMRPAIATATTEFAPPEQHTRAFGLNRLAMNLGMSIGPVVGGLLATIDFQLLFYVNAVFVAAAAAVLAVAFDLHAHRREIAESPAPSPTRSPWNDRPYLAFLGLKLASAIVFFQLIGALPIYWKEQYGMTEFSIGVLFVINTLLIVAFEMLLVDRLGYESPLRKVAVGTGLVCLGFGATVFGSGFAFAAALCVVWTLGEMLSAPYGLTAVARFGEGAARSAYIGLFSTTMALAFVAAPLLGTALYDVDPRLPWWCALALAPVLPLGFAALENRLRAPNERATPTPCSAPPASQHACE